MSSSSSTDFAWEDRIKKILDKFSVKRDFEELIEKGCDARKLLISLNNLLDPPFSDDWENLTGFSGPKKFARLISRMRTQSDEIRAIGQNAKQRQIQIRTKSQRSRNEFGRH